MMDFSGVNSSSEPSYVEKSDLCQVGICRKVAKSTGRVGALGLAIPLFPLGQTIALAATLTVGGANGILVPTYVIHRLLKSKKDCQEGFWNKSFGEKFNLFKEAGLKPTIPFNKSFENLAAFGFQKDKQKIQKINGKINSVIGSAGTGIGTFVGGGISLAGVAVLSAVSLLITGIGISISDPYPRLHSHCHRRCYR